jgi:hypothetical protein
MRSIITTLVFGSAIAVAAFATVATPRPAFAEDRPPVCDTLSGQARVNCDARLSKWMQRQTERIDDEAADGGCGPKCRALKAKRNNAAAHFESNED